MNSWDLPVSFSGYTNLFSQVVTILSFRVNIDSGYPDQAFLLKLFI